MLPGLMGSICAGGVTDFLGTHIIDATVKSKYKWVLKVLASISGPLLATQIAPPEYEQGFRLGSLGMSVLLGIRAGDKASRRLNGGNLLSGLVAGSIVAYLGTRFLSPTAGCVLAALTSYQLTVVGSDTALLS